MTTDSAAVPAVADVPAAVMWWVVALGIVLSGTREEATSKHLRNGFDRTTLLGPFASEAEAKTRCLY